MTGRTTRCAAGVLAALSALAVAACGDGAATSPSSSAAVDVTGGTETSGPTSSEPGSTGTTPVEGWLVARYTVDGDAAAAATTMQQRVDSAGVDGEVRVDGADLVVEIHHVTGTDADLLAQTLAAGLDRVYVRPVIGPCSVLRLPTTTEASAPSDSVDRNGLPIVQPDPTTAQIVPLAGAAELTYCQIGPSTVTGAVFLPDAEATEIPGVGPGVVVSLRPGADGVDAWNALAAACYQGDATCPTKQLAIQVDGALVTVATVQTPTFEGSVQISGSFSAASAQALADTLATAASPAMALVSYSFTPA